MTGLETWSTDELPALDRFPVWAEKVRSLHMEWELSAPTEDDYVARIRHRGTHQVSVADVRCGAFGGKRDALAGNKGVVGIQLQLSGRMKCSYGESEFTLEPGDLFIWDGNLGGNFKSEGPHRQLSIIVPASRVSTTLAASLQEIRPLSTRPGAGALSLVAGQIRNITREMALLNDDVVNRSVSGLLDVLDAAMAPAVESSSSQRATLLRDVQNYILERLDDRELSVSSIAAAHWISVRTLHLVFSESGTTVARWVRQQRLERSRLELSNATGSTNVTSVAFRWGFNDVAHFSRAFKQEFGVPPTAVMPQRTSA